MRRRLLIVGASLIGLLLLIVAALYGLMASESGREWIKVQLESQLSTPGEAEITIGRIEGALPASVQLLDLRISDKVGVWLTADRIGLHWSPWSLAGRKLRIEALSVGSLAILRAPEMAPSEEPDTQFELPALPLDLALERLSVERLELGEPLLGVPASLRVEGEAGAQAGEDFRAALSVARIDGAEGRIALDARYERREDRLSLELEAREPAGGLTARLLALPDLPALALALQGEGPLADWQGRLAASAEGLAEGSAELALARDADRGLRLILTGSARLTMPEPAPWARLLNGDLEFNADAGLQDDSRVTLAQARLESDALEATLAGRLDLPDLALDANARLSTKQPGLFNDLIGPLSLSGLTAELRAEGALLQPELRAKIEAAGLSAPDITAEAATATLAFEPTSPIDGGTLVGRLAGDGSLSGLRFVGLDPLPALIGDTADWRLNGDLAAPGDRLAISVLTMTGAAIGLEGSGSAALESGDLAFSGSLTLPDLAVFADLSGLALSGSAETAFDLRAAAAGATATVALDTEFRDLGTGQPAADLLLGPQPHVFADLRLAADGSPSVEDLRLDGRALSVIAAAGLDSAFERLEGRFDIALPDLSVLSPVVEQEITGRLSVTGETSGPLANPSLTGDAGIEGLRAAGLDLGRATARIGLDRLATGPQGQVALALEPPSGRIEAVSGLAVIEDLLRLDALQLSAQDAQAEGAFVIPLDGSPITGGLTGRVEDLAPWAGLAGVAASGRADIRLSLADGEGRQSAEARVALADFGLEGEAALSLGTATIDLGVADAIELAGITLEARLAALTLDALSLDETSLRATGDSRALALALETGGRFIEPLSLQGTATLGLDADRQSLNLESLSGEALKQSITLERPLAVTRSPDGFRLSGLDLRIGEGRVSGNARADGQGTAIDLQARDLPLALAGLAAPDLEPSGKLSLDLAVSGPAEAPNGTASLRLAEAGFGESTGLPGLDATVDAVWQANRLELDGRLGGFGGPEARLDAELPLRMSIDGPLPVLPTDEPVSGRLAWRGELATVWPLLPFDDHRLAGTADLDARLSGSFAAPRADGRLTLADGRYENLASGTLLEQLAVAVAFDDRSLRIEELTASDGGDGKLTGNGTLSLDPEAGLPFAIEAAFTDFTLLRRDEVTAASDGTLAVTGSLEAAEVAGRFETKRVEIGIPETLPPEVVELQVTEVNRSALGEADTETAKPAEPAAPLDIALDVAVAMPGRVFLRGRGLESEWRGDLAVSGAADAPAIRGRLELVKGQLTVLNRTFTLTRGQVSFDGGAEIDPLLDIEAQNESGGLTVTARITGLASQPTITLASSPELPQDEILARVLFGKSTTQLSPLEALQLAQAAAELSGRGGGSGGVLDFARKLIGVDVLRIEGGDPGSATAGPSLAAGKYLREGVYVGVKQGTTVGSGSLGVELEVTPNISLESGVGQTGGSNLGVKFKWDY